MPLQELGSVWRGCCGRAPCQDGSDAWRGGRAGRASRCSRCVCARRRGTGAVWPLRSGPSETHFLFLGSDKCRCRSPQPGSRGSGGLSLTAAVSRDSCPGCPVKRLSKAQPKPAVRLSHSRKALICAACVAGSAQPLGRKGLDCGGG